jgi:photosystem II stability/assembly factor-like uncharacterized protein
MRLAYRRYGGEKGFTADQFRRVAEEVAGTDLEEPFRKWLGTTEELDYSEALDWFGLRLAADGKEGARRWRLEVREDATDAQRNHLRAWLAPRSAQAKTDAEAGVTTVPEEVVKRYGLDTSFYKKHVDYKGLAILASARVSDAALLEARYLIDQLLGEREDILQAMIKAGCRFTVMARTEMTTDVPEQRIWDKEYWDRRARGMGGRLSSCGEENLLNLKGDRYGRENILIHEFNHAVHRYGLREVDPTFDRRLREAYKNAVAEGLWKGTYLTTNAAEYWAEGVQAYFDCMRPQYGANTREKLQKYDAGLFALVDEVYRQSKFRYVRYDKRSPPGGELTAETVLGLEPRGLGPALRPGRVGDIAVDPFDDGVWYVAAASGGLWKTADRGSTWTPVFDRYGSYSIGCVTLDPKHRDVVWLGTGENQASRSVSYGDGIYKSTDGGRTWKHVGLANSEHIAKIVLDPRDSDVVYVASQGPLWAPGGDRGLYKSTDGGKTWKSVLHVSDDTGITDVVFDPRDPDVLLAASYQRRRNVGVLVGGGPEGGIYKSSDGGTSWARLSEGLPAVDLGRVALAVSPQEPGVAYALLTAAGREGGFFRSADFGETWQRRSDYAVVDPQYYGKIFPDPHRSERVYAVDVRVHVTEDGGQTFKPVPWRVHSDNHAMAFDPKDPKHLLVGNDGGLYESKDGGESWAHFTNMPTTQFYRVALDNSLPFYRVYGGSQDNGSLGGPSRTTDRLGIRTGDWRVYGGGDGMQPRVDPGDPSVVYTVAQNGSVSRSGKGSIRPQAPRGAVRWNWDAPFIISPHAPGRLYLAGSVLYRSDDRGDTWRAVSPDLTRQLDRDKVPVMGKLWGPDAVTRNLFTTDLSVASALAESPLREGLLFVGTDDGLVQVSADGGAGWRRCDRFPGVPELTYVSALCPSQHDAGRVYAAFNNWQRGDFKPYLLRSTDRGKTWTSIAGNLPDRGNVWCVVEDQLNRDLLFAGTEFGLYFTVDGGKRWVPLRGGVPTIAFRDLEIQYRENDLVGATFGRGFYVLDDYTPLRHLSAGALAGEAVLFPVRKTYRFDQGDADAAAGLTTPNPPFGAALTYYLRDGLARKDAQVVLAVSDQKGTMLRQIRGPATAGVHRVYWDLRAGDGAEARLVDAGKYRVTLGKSVGGVVTPLGEPQAVEVVPLPPPAEKGGAGPDKDRKEPS